MSGLLRIGNTSAKASLKYMIARNMVNGHCDKLWIVREGTGLKDSSVETLFIKLSKLTGIAVHPHLLRHTFATLWLIKSNSRMLQRLLGHTTLTMTNKYCQAVGCYDAVEAHKRFSPMDRLMK